MTDPRLKSDLTPADLAATTAPSEAPDAGLPPSVDTSVQRYRLLEEIAGGGMGVVWRATDAVLGREVAVKLLQDRYALDSGTARRFADEARITAQLQHPAIPPVHDLGTLPDGRPFLAMKLIKGQTLEKLLAARPDPSAERGRFVAVFEQVCQAVAYAHAHGVIHRDLKPANVMVGAFGEVQLMDWGLAKVLGRQASETVDASAASAAASVISLREADGLLTQAGSVLGTPAYMPPEQAAGAVGEVDQRSDVFGLGGILAVVLTGEPPFTAASAEKARFKAAQGELSDCFARLDGCGAEPELVALCKRCLHPRASERPTTGVEVAAAVAELRQAAEERARSAELERVRAEGERRTAELRALEQRRRRRVQWALTLALALLLIGGLAFGWWQSEQGRAARERQTRNAEAVTGLLNQCEQKLRAGDAAAAALTLEAARKRAAEGGAESEAERLARCQDDLDMLRELDAIDQFRWTSSEDSFPKSEATASRSREVLGRFGMDPDKLDVEAATARLSGSALRERLVTALDRLLRAQKSAAVRAALASLDPDFFRDAVRDAVLANNPAALAKLAAQAETLAQPPGFAAFLGESDAIALERRRALLMAALQHHPNDQGLLMQLGGSYPINQREGAAERTQWYQAAVAVAPANTAAHNNLGVALLDKKDVEGALVAYRQAIQLDSRSVLAHYNLGNALRAKKDVDGAIAAYREAIRLGPGYVPAHNNLGLALCDKRDLDGAVAAYRQAIRLSPKEATVRGNLGKVLYDKKDLDGAVAAYRQAIRLDSKNALVHYSLGVALHDKKDVDGAIAAYRQAIRLDPSYAPAHNNLGNVLRDKKDLDGALAAYREVVRLDPKHAPAHNNLGVALSGKRDLDGAVAAFQEAIRLDPKLAAALSNLGFALENKGDFEGAIAAYQKTLRLNPTQPLVLTNLSRARRMRQLQIRLPDVLTGKDKPRSPADTCELALFCLLSSQNRYADALRLFQDAFAADPKLAEDLSAGHRCRAAFCAVLLGCGKGKDADKRKDPERAKLRQQALAWLHADLILHRRQAGSREGVQRQITVAYLSFWVQASELAGVRPGPARITMSEEERAAWDKLWIDVKATLALARKPPTTATGK